MAFNPVTDTHLFPDTIVIGDSVEISIKINGNDAMTYTKVIDQVPASNGKLLATVSIVEQE